LTETPAPTDFLFVVCYTSVLTYLHTVLSEVICKAREDEGYVTEYCNILLYIMTLWLLLFDFMQFSQENEGVMHLGLFY